MADQNIVIEEANGKAGRAAFVDLGREFAASVPHSVPQIRSEQLELIDPGKNPFFGHARVQLFIAYRAGKPVGRIAAHIDHLALELPVEQGMGPGTGMFGYFDAEDEAVANALLERAEAWLRDKGMTRVIGPISLSIWEEPGLLVKGHDHSPMIMMGHDPAHYQPWIEGAGYGHAKSLLTYDLDISKPFPPLIQRIVQSGERNERIRIRPVDKSRWPEEIRQVLEILNDAWSDNWGFVPFTEDEIAYAAKKLKPVIKPELNMLAELDGRPVAFMVVLPDINEVLSRTGGKLFPFGWFHLLRALGNPKGLGMRVPLMGVLKEFQSSRLASQLAFMLISKIRENANDLYGSTRGEIGWILDDNKGMIAIADAIESKINREYVIYEKAL
ncbi:N-acetyltransferase [Qipengyuania gaetbuli]|uniref:N-acetyltransferase n=1 Tax=Qipengyuania gaetbuli TaxID=266952 RepID=UPI001CD33D0E|nr:N-acetyltransferase [Qipengyuania gaetbuli]MCA0910582.1 N-acetyltransferase [Qipengyuania gaetbuli]